MKFKIDENVLVRQGPLLYDAKCLQIGKDSSKNYYYVHYKGWKSKYDEWVVESDVFKLTSDNLEEKTRLLQEWKNVRDVNSKSRSKKRKLTWTQREQSQEDSSYPRQQIRDRNTRRNRSYATRTSVRSILRNNLVSIPNTLRRVLLRDWTLITQQRKRLIVPCKPTVSEILRDFLDCVKYDPKRTVNVSGYVEVISGIKKIFDRFAGSKLLYDSEYEQRTNKKTCVECEYYGGVHLLRLMAKMDGMLQSCGKLDRKPIHRVLRHLVIYLSDHRNHLYSDSNYV